MSIAHFEGAPREMTSPSGPGPRQRSERPGFAPDRMARLIREAVDRVGLDLTGLTVLTEAATGAYGVTAAIAAAAGAKQVHAMSRSSRYGTAAESIEWTRHLAGSVGALDRISFCEAIPDHPESIDIVTNSGHLRPITSALISRLPAHGVIALMFEAWELRDGDIDVDACRHRGIRIVGVNERHPSIDVFSYLGPLCVHQLQSAGLPVYRTRIAILCDNDFGPFIKRSLDGLGAEATLFDRASALRPDQWDCVVVALHPRPEARIGPEEARILASRARGALIAQFWGDMDRGALGEFGLPVSPANSPKPGHMAVLLSDIGPEPVVRLQSGGLKAAEQACRARAITPDGIAQLV